MKEKLKLYLNNEKIFFETNDEIIYGDKSIIFPIVINDELYFFKFLDKYMYSKICLEVNIVNKLINKGIKAHEYYNKNGNCVFQNDEYCFYGTKSIGDNNIVENNNYHILNNVIKNIAVMHNELFKISFNECRNIVNKSNDYIELQNFYVNNRSFISANNLSIYIKKILEQNYNVSEYLFIHYDLNFKNIMINQNSFAGFIDFTDFKIGCREDDLGKFFQNVIYLKNITNQDIYNLIDSYNKESNVKLNKENLKVSMLYRIIYRYFCAMKEDFIDETYKNDTQKVLKKVIEL